MQRVVKALLTGILAALVLVLYIQTRAPAEPAATAYYTLHAIEDTGAGNVVAAIYLNYRVYDSLFETLMLLVSVMGVVHLSWRGRHG